MMIISSKQSPACCSRSSLPVVCVMSAMALIYTKHESRKLFVELEALTTERDELNIEWGQLQIEQSTWATHARIERVRDGRAVAGKAEVNGNLRH